MRSMTRSSSLWNHDAVVAHERARVEADRVDDERVAFPLRRRVAVKQRVGILRMRTSVGADDAEVVEHFDQLHEQSRCLNELDGIGVAEPDRRKTARNAVDRQLGELRAASRSSPSSSPRRRAGTPEALSGVTAGSNCRSAARSHLGAGVFDVGNAGPVRPPHAGQIRLAVGRARRRAARRHDADLLSGTRACCAILGRRGKRDRIDERQRGDCHAAARR